MVVKVAFVVSIIFLFKTQALVTEIEDVTSLFPAAQDAVSISKETFQHIFEKYNVSLVHGTKANTLLPLLSRTNYEMLNVLDLLQMSVAPMVGELNNGIRYDAGINLKQLDFVSPSERMGLDYWDYARSNYGIWAQSHLNKDSQLINTRILKLKLQKICDDIIDDDLARKDDLFIKLSIAVIRLELFDIDALTSDGALVEKIQKAQRACLEFIGAFMKRLRRAISICDDSDFQLQEDRVANKVVTDKIVALFQQKLGVNRFSNVSDCNFDNCGISGRSNGHINDWLEIMAHTARNSARGGDSNQQQEFIHFHLLDTFKSPAANKHLAELPYTLQLNVCEFTIMLKQYPYIVLHYKYDHKRNPIDNISRHWRKLLENTLAFERERYELLQKVIISEPVPLAGYEKEFLVNNDIPMVVGMTNPLPVEERNHIKFGKTEEVAAKCIDVIVVEKRNLKAVQTYIDKHFGYDGTLKILTFGNHTLHNDPSILTV